MDPRNLLIAAAMASAAVPAAAAPVAATTNASGRAALLLPLTLTKIDDLDFGTMISSGSSGTVALNATTGNRAFAGGVTGVPSAAGHRAYFGGAGSPSQQVIVTVNPPATLANTNGDTIDVLALDPRRRPDPLDRPGHPRLLRRRRRHPDAERQPARRRSIRRTSRSPPNISDLVACRAARPNWSSCQAKFRRPKSSACPRSASLATARAKSLPSSAIRASICGSMRTSASSSAAIATGALSLRGDRRTARPHDCQPIPATSSTAASIRMRRGGSPPSICRATTMASSTFNIARARRSASTTGG